MKTAKDISDFYFPSDDMSASNLELDILRYLEFHLKVRSKHIINPEGCSHSFTIINSSDLTTNREVCVKCGVYKFVPVNRPFSSQKVD